MLNERFLNDIVPQLPAALLKQMQMRYPDIRLQPQEGFAPLTIYPVCMVVGLTGTGKSTTLDKLAELREAGQVAYREDIPSRRELADWLVIPTVQIINGQAVQPVKDREQRFALTRQFAQEFEPGGLAAVYGWLYYRGDEKVPIVSEAVRGPREIAYVLEHAPHWKVFELWVPPLIRLQRLSGRGDAFDQVAQSSIDVAFLPPESQNEARALLQAGKITPEAITTIAAEARNYGHQPFDATNSTANYRYLAIDRVEPAEAAAEMAQFLTNA